MTYYDTLQQDLARAKQILEKGRPNFAEDAAGLSEGSARLEAISGGTIYGADIYAAYKLLESFVAVIEAMQRPLPDDLKENVLQAVARLAFEQETGDDWHLAATDPGLDPLWRARAQPTPRDSPKTEAVAGYRCPRCGRVSHNPNDLTNRYCGFCHEFEKL